MNDNFELKYRTSGEAKVSLKRKVFCAYHPNDARFLDEVFQDLSKACECTLFYYEPGNEPKKEQLETDLGSMNLFVLIVTRDFLFKPSFASKVAYTFAQKHGIPVLPILFESELEESFNEKIGNLQCLSKVQELVDATAVPYHEKLSNFLSQVLSADADMKRCYDAFDTSIFLSYRKKDRKYAQRLMEMIHAHEKCRNIAIWYDEFLVPGEDFNDGIKSELEDSSLFVLVVTPHIVEGDNYITLTEYPMATSLNKRVLPFQLARTDGKKLKEFCPGIGKPFPTLRSAHVRKVILDSLNKLGVVQGENTVERTFLIGLAYLKGICVEKNSKVGFSKILQAAKGGFREAMQLLVLLYRNAEGTKQNLKAATQWQERILSVYEKDYEADPCEENTHKLIKAYFDLAQLQEHCKDYTSAHQTYRRIIIFCGNKSIKDKIYALKYAATAYELSGKLYMLEGNYGEARMIYFEESCKVRKQILELEPTLQAQLELIEVHELVGECFELIDSVVGLKSQLAVIKKLMRQVEDIEANAENYDLLRRFMLCNYRAGKLCNVVKLWDTAAPYMEESIALAERLVEISNTRQAKRHLMLSYMSEGDRYLNCDIQDCTEEAFAQYEKAYEIAASLWEEKETQDAQLDLATILQKQAYILERMNTLERAIDKCERALTHFRSAHALAPTLPIKRKLAMCCFEAARLYCSGKNKEKELALLQESVKMSEEAFNIRPSAGLRRELAKICEVLGDYYKSEWKVKEALYYCQKNHELLRDVWLGRHVVRDLMFYLGSFKKYIAAAKLAGDFKLAQELDDERLRLYADNANLLKQVYGKGID